MAMTMGNQNGGSYQPMSEINVTPFVDVMLVLLVIFMVTAPMMVQGLDVHLPKAEAAAALESKERVTITITRDKRVKIGSTVVEMARLREVLASNAKIKKDKEVDLYAEDTLPYGFIVEVMALARAGGAETINMVTDR